MRVVVGKCRGRRLIAPPGLATRPILDRVKQALFDALSVALGSPGPWPPIAVLDLYAGAGSLGIEALSRGAASCCFVESAAAALTCLRRNLSDLGLADQAVIVRGAAEKAAVPAAPSGAFGLVFLDPPYPLSAGFSTLAPFGRTLARLGADIPVAPDGLAVWRYPSTITPPASLPGDWRIERARSYGRNQIAFLRRGSL